MTYKRFQNDLASQDGKAWVDSGQYKWNQSVDIAIVVGEYHVYRMRIDIPKNAVIQLATFRAEYVVKNAETVPQSFSANVFMEFNSAPYPNVDDVFLGPSGAFPPLPRIRTQAVSSYTVNYTSNTTEADFINVPVATQLQEIVNRPDYEPGMYHAVILNPTAETGDITIRTRNQAFAAEHPHLAVYYKETNPLTVTERYSVNHLGNHSFDDSVNGWGGHSAFGTYTDAPVLVRGTQQSRRGGAALRVSAGSTDATKGFMAYTNFTTGPGRSYVFCGWVYVPASNPNPFQAQWLYHSASLSVTVKDQWVPFCTPVYNIGNETKTIWPTVVSNGSSDPNYHFYVDDLAVIESPYMQYPFDDSSPDHRRLDFKNFYTAGLPSVVRKGSAHVSAKVNPFVVLDNIDSLTGWTVTNSNITFSQFNGGVRATIPAGIGAAYITYTPTAALTHKKRFLVINSEGADSTLTKVNTSVGGLVTQPLEEAYEAAGVGTRKFYEFSPNYGNLTSFEWSVYAHATNVTTLTIYDIGSSDRLTAQETLGASTGWVLKEGLWVRTTTDRQSPTWDEYGSMTWDQLEATGKTWDQMEATDV